MPARVRGRTPSRRKVLFTAAVVVVATGVAFRADRPRTDPGSVIRVPGPITVSTVVGRGAGPEAGPATVAGDPAPPTDPGNVSPAETTAIAAIDPRAAATSTPVPPPPARPTTATTGSTIPTTSGTAGAALAPVTSAPPVGPTGETATTPSTAGRGDGRGPAPAATVGASPTGPGPVAVQARPPETVPLPLPGTVPIHPSVPANEHVTAGAPTPAAPPADAHPTPVDYAIGSASSTVLGVVATVGPCHHLALSVAERDDSVTLAATSWPIEPPPGAACPATGAPVLVEVTLTRPLGGRPVIDLHRAEPPDPSRN